MELVSELKLSEKKSLQLFKGDLTNISDDHKVDFLVLSAFPDNYSPTTTSLIGGLHRKGLSIEKLSKNKELDLRAFSHCWISKEIDYPNTKRILCFEPIPHTNPYSQIAEIFQSLTFISKSHSIKTIAMPLLMTGDQNYSEELVVKELVNTSLLWLEKTPFEIIKIVEIDESKVNSLKLLFSQKKKINTSQLPKAPAPPYDFFVSYSRKNTKEVEIIKNVLGEKFNLFIDTEDIDIGTNWLDKLNTSMANSKRFIVCLSDAFVQSKFCKYEYSFCNLKFITEGSDTVLPIYLYSADLPFEMSILNFFNAREGDTEKINEFCQMILSKYN